MMSSPAVADARSASVPAGALRRLSLKRHPFPTPALRERELQWWARFGANEERYFWVLPHSWQPPARMRYLDRIAAGLADCSHVVDYGCGNGWLSRALAERLQRPVTGVDFSPEQIALASRANADCAWTLFAAIQGVEDLPPAPAYVFHGVLHHLSTHEIHDLLQRVAQVRGARAFFVEPVCFPLCKPDARDRVLLDEMEHLVQEPWRVAAERGVAVPEPVRGAREEGAERWWGEAPFGPSPMERPFEFAEFGPLLASYFDITTTELVQYLPASQALAGELAMLTDAHAALADELAPSLMAQMDALERAWLRMPQPADSGWYMALVEARTR